MTTDRDPRLTLSIDEAARLIGVSRPTIERQLAAGTFPVPTVKVGRRRLIPRLALEQFLNSTEGDAA